MPLPKAIKAKFDARAHEFELNQDTLNQKLAFATQTYYQGLPHLGAGTTTHEKLLLVFKDLSDLLIAIKSEYKLYDVETQYTRNRDGVFRVCLVKPQNLQDKELSKIEADIKRDYKKSLIQIKEQVINEVIEEVAAEKSALEEQQRLDKVEKNQNNLRKALLDAA
ncbi:hypothetical protein EU510_12285 [Pseudoalteromonas sp. FUC4]|uniref:hypothetical protein n=1 Tax=Pseudoalteromonas sp. FUC4 TaxID=2511201 RepID=UPI0011F354D8|nr:hypothetical protein [Pseudoalteromonas sp. FUC4]KAA1151639.1 hypothetical protein EU510_12285 [Pseudoalteromonas sp. FUC4]